METKPWERQRDTDGNLEPIRWYRRFTQFRLLGPGRSLLAAYRTWKAERGADPQYVTYIPKAWERAAAKWHWLDRADAWDAEQADRPATRPPEPEGASPAAAPTNPWERQPWQTPAHYRAFHEFYYPQKPPRSVDQAYRDWYIEKHGLQKDDIRAAKKRAITCWQNWSRGNTPSGDHIKGALTWVELADLRDRELAAQDHAIWEERRRQIKQREWEQSEKLLVRAEAMLGYPLSEVTQIDDEGRQFRVQPIRWRQSDVTRFLETASKLARLAAEMETEKAALDLTSKGEKLDPNVIVVRDYLAAQEAQETAENVDGE